VSKENERRRIEIELEIARKMEMRFATVQDIVVSQFAFAAKTIRSGEFESVMLPYLGKFKPSPKTLKWINERKAQKIYEGKGSNNPGRKREPSNKS